MKIRVWHGEKHDDATVTEIEVADMHRWVAKARMEGGFFAGEKLNGHFVPWHRINWIERAEEEDAVEPSGREASHEKGEIEKS